jgi:hypothetical protein
MSTLIMNQIKIENLLDGDRRHRSFDCNKERRSTKMKQPIDVLFKVQWTIFWNAAQQCQSVKNPSATFRNMKIVSKQWFNSCLKLKSLPFSFIFCLLHMRSASLTSICRSTERLFPRTVCTNWWIKVGVDCVEWLIIQWKSSSSCQKLN